MEMLYFADANDVLMRKLAVLALLALFLFNIGGYFLWFRISQQVNYSQVRREIRAGLDDRFLDVIRVPADGVKNITWTKPDKEFSFRGEMYDVVKSKTEPGAVVYYCLKDTTEKALIARFSRKAHEEQQRTKMLKKIPLLSFIFQPDTLGSLAAPCSTLLIFWQSFYHSPEMESHSPPPNDLFS
jgi:hypothetical protein